MSSIQPTKQRVALRVPAPRRVAPAVRGGSEGGSQGAAGGARGHLAAAGAGEDIQLLPLLLQLEKEMRVIRFTMKDCVQVYQP